MSVDQRVVERFQQLIADGENVLRTKSKTTEEGTSYLGEYAVNRRMAYQWGTSCLNLLKYAFGEETDSYSRFRELVSDFEVYSVVDNALGILKGAKSDYESGFMNKANQITHNRPRRIFISHGRSPDWHRIQAYIEKDARMETLELAQQANRGRTVLQKLWDESGKCSYAVIVMTGDDDTGEGERPRARENVMHEIGFFQGRYGLENVCLLYEEGTSIPSNIHGLVYIPFPKGRIETTLGDLRRELEAAFPES
jgi:predicted nucleotide-binding protein